MAGVCNKASTIGVYTLLVNYSGWQTCPSHSASTVQLLPCYMMLECLDGDPSTDKSLQCKINSQLENLTRRLASEGASGTF